MGGHVPGGGALNTQLIKRFRAAGLEIPYPQRDVYVYQR